jgi:hypothetical protein
VTDPNYGLIPVLPVQRTSNTRIRGHTRWLVRSKSSYRKCPFFAQSSAFVVTLPCFGPIRFVACFRVVDENMRTDILFDIAPENPQMPVTRRGFMQGAAALGAASLALSFDEWARHLSASEVAGGSGFGPLRPARDEATGLELLELPEGFRYWSRPTVGSSKFPRGAPPTPAPSGAWDDSRTRPSRSTRLRA